MSKEPLYSLKEAAAQLGAYPELLRNLIARHEVPHRTPGNMIVLTDEGIDQLRPLVDAWKNRPRMSKRPAAASA